MPKKIHTIMLKNQNFQNIQLLKNRFLTEYARLYPAETLIITDYEQNLIPKPVNLTHYQSYQQEIQARDLSWIHYLMMQAAYAFNIELSKIYKIMTDEIFIMILPEFYFCGLNTIGYMPNHDYHEPLQIDCLKLIMDEYIGPPINTVPILIHGTKEPYMKSLKKLSMGDNVIVFSGTVWWQELDNTGTPIAIYNTALAFHNQQLIMNWEKQNLSPRDGLGDPMDNNNLEAKKFREKVHIRNEPGLIEIPTIKINSFIHNQNYPWFVCDGLVFGVDICADSYFHTLMYLRSFKHIDIDVYVLIAADGLLHPDDFPETKAFIQCDLINGNGVLEKGISMVVHGVDFIL